MKRVLIAILMAALAATAARAQDSLPGTSSIASSGVDQWSVFGTGESHRMMADQTLPGGYAFVVKTATAGKNAWEIQATVPTAQPIHQGDVLLLVFWAKSLTPEGSISLVIANLQQNQPPYRLIGGQSVQIGPTWKLYYIAGTSSLDLGPGQAAASLQLAIAPNETALGPVFIRNFGPGYDLTKLPTN